MTAVWSWPQKLLRWVGRWWQALAGGLAVAVVSFLALGMYRRRVANLRDAVEVEQAIGEIKALRARRDELAAENRRDDDEIRRIDHALVSNVLKIEAARKRANVSADELADEFARLGF